MVHYRDLDLVDIFNYLLIVMPLYDSDFPEVFANLCKVHNKLVQISSILA